MSKILKYPNARFNNDGIYFDYDHREDFFNSVRDSGCNDRSPFVYLSKGYNKGYKIFNVPCSFDTETTSYIVRDENNKRVKTGFMYVWMMGINGYSLYGRTWKQWFDVLKRCKEEYGLSENKRMIIYIHNMPFDFQFFRKMIHIDDIFFMESRKALYILSDCFEFRCSLMLTGESLAKVGEHLVKYKCEKLVGDLNYKLVRHFNTPLTKKEIGYCINDVRVQMCKIRELMDDEDGNLALVPYTMTGYVRRDIKKAIKEDKESAARIRNLKLTPLEYKMWHRSFQGGFTHGNYIHTGETCEDVTSYDFTSSYPTQMIAQKYPMSNGELVEWTDWDTDYDNNFKKFCELTRSYILLFNVKLSNIELKENMPDAPLAKAKCRNVKGLDMVDNGRIRECEYAETTVDSVTFEMLQKYYKFDFEIGTCFKYMKGYLPKPIIDKILYYYELKTTLKDVVGKEQEYQQGKAKLNSIFGNFVMDIVREIFMEWGESGKEPTNEQIEEQLDKYNKNKNRSTWYPWGCMITAYARKALLNGIYEVGYYDYIYSDTDSMKIFNAQDHLGYILQYNREITEKLEACLDYYGIDKSRLKPKTIEDEEKPLGVWDFDGHYSKFKVLHAKCYISTYSDDERNPKKKRNKLGCTIAGLPKSSGVDYLKKQSDPYEAFADGMKINKKISGKNGREYCDDEYTFEVRDYLGNIETVTSPSGVYLSAIPFEVGLGRDYDYFLKAMGCLIEEEGE